MKKNFCTPQEAIKKIRNGKIIILVDDQSRENEGDFVMAAQFATPKKIQFMINESRSFITCPIDNALAKKLNIKPMVTPSKNEESSRCNFSISVDARKNITTGVSAHDKTLTVKLLGSEKTKPSDLIRPGHIFPIISKEHGLMQREGHTEGSVDLLKLAGLVPAAAIAEIVNADGTMARRDDLKKIAEKHSLKILLIKDLKQYILATKKFPKQKHVFVNEEVRGIKNISTAKLPTHFGQFKITIFQSLPDNLEHAVLIMGAVKNEKDILVRIHSECLTGDCLFSARCDCGAQLQSAIEKIASEKKGLIIYLNQEGRGIGLANKIRAYALQDKGLDTAQANEALGFKIDERDMWVAKSILDFYKIPSIKLLTNNPKKISMLKSYGFINIKRSPHKTAVTRYNKTYLETKKKKMGHLL